MEFLDSCVPPQPSIVNESGLKKKMIILKIITEEGGVVPKRQTTCLVNDLMFEPKNERA